ncbi:MAG: hypothetical protein U1A77_23575 [Pirellulales bacterium]
MASANRKELVDHSEVGVYHCASLCVRRGNVQGKDSVSGLDRSHRSRWIQERLESLAGVFAVEVLDYGIVDNSMHTLLRIRPDVTGGWSDEEVLHRWYRLNRRRLQLQLKPLSRRRLKKLLANKERIIELRNRLSNLSWFMIMLKEPIAREANAEDGVTGHFFGERFWCRRCHTVEDALQAMVYSHTNPVRAGLAETPETAEYSSYRERLEDQAARGEDQGLAWSEGANSNSNSNESLVGGLQERPLGDPAGRAAEAVPHWRTSDLRSIKRRRADWLASLSLEGDGYDGAGDGRRLTNEGFLGIGLNEYREVLEACHCEGGYKTEGKDEAGSPYDGNPECGCAGGNHGMRDAKRWRQSLPAELPARLERLGLDPQRWAESFRGNERRFDWLTWKSDSLRRDFLQKSLAT